MAVIEINALRKWPRKRQHHGHEHTAEIQGVPDIVERILDEGRGPMQPGIESHPFLIEQGLHILDRRLDRSGHVHRVGAILTGERHEHAGPALDERVPKFGRGRFGHRGHVLQAHALAAVGRHHDSAQRLRRQRLAVGLD